MAKSDDKWLTLVPDQPAAEAARYALRVRSAAIFQHIGPAVESPDEPEHVHQLRVATRRTGAVLRLFADCFPEKRLRRANRRVRDLRRAAGGARDWDVFLDATAADTILSAETRAYLLGFAASGRIAAQHDLRSAAEQSHDAKTAVADLAAVAHTPPDAPDRTAAELGQRELTALFDEFTADIAAGPTTPEQLHAIRIAGKRLRYALEVFSRCLNPALISAVYPVIVDLQESLGRVNDAHVAAGRLTAIRDGLRAHAPSAVESIGSDLTNAISAREAEVTAGAESFREWAERWQQLLAEHPPAVLLVGTAFAP